MLDIIKKTFFFDLETFLKKKKKNCSIFMTFSKIVEKYIKKKIQPVLKSTIPKSAYDTYIHHDILRIFSFMHDLTNL